MGDMAHGEPSGHIVFQEPFKINPPIETIKTPGNYRKFPEGDKLPGEMKVWRVQKTGKPYGGAAGWTHHFGDSPDAEIITIGQNCAKEYGTPGISRHANILQWGYAASPSRMTPAGRRLFVNCVHYIHKYDGKGPLTTQIDTSPREDAIQFASRNDSRYYGRCFPMELKAKFGNDNQKLQEYYQDNLELIYCDEKNLFRLDEELKSLGIESNRKPETLERLIQLLDDPQKEVLAIQLLCRYTRRNTQIPQEWKKWYKKRQGRFFFNDLAGYKFIEIPEGYFE